MNDAPRSRVGWPSALAGLVLAVAGAALADDTAVRGSGRVVAEARSVAAFHAIDLKGGGMNLVVRPGPSERLEVRADDNLLPFIETIVVDRRGVPTLEIRNKRGMSFRSGNPILVTADVVTLEALALSGSGEVRADGLRAGNFKASISGSGPLQLNRFTGETLALDVSGSGAVRTSGRVSTLAVAIPGSGDVSASELEAEDASVRIAGSGHAAVHARRTLSVTIAGSGAVDYVGEPTVHSTIGGAGSVRKR